MRVRERRSPEGHTAQSRSAEPRRTRLSFRGVLGSVPLGSRHLRGRGGIALAWRVGLRRNHFFSSVRTVRDVSGPGSGGSASIVFGAVAPPKLSQ